LCAALFAAILPLRLTCGALQLTFLLTLLPDLVALGLPGSLPLRPLHVAIVGSEWDRGCG
jgi:hypothetical protein